MATDTKASTWTRKQRFQVGFTAGLAAGVIASIIMLVLNAFANGILLPDIVGSALTTLLSPSQFDYLHQLIGANAKHYLFYGVLVGQCLVFALSGGLYDLLLTPSEEKQAEEDGKRRWKVGLPVTHMHLRWYHGLLLAFILWLLAGFGLLPLTGVGIFGSQLSIGLANSMVSLAITGASFGLLFVGIHNWLVDRIRTETAIAPSPSEARLSRRRILQRGLIMAGIALLGVGAWRFITEGASSSTAPAIHLLQRYKSKIIPPPKPNYGDIHPAPNLSPEITSNGQFYIVSKNLFSDPTVDASNWRLTVDGHVEHPFTLTYQELLALPMHQQYETLECISNEVGGNLMSNALWEGVRLRDLLQRTGIKQGTLKILFFAVDDYSESIYLEKALEPTTLLAVRMNGVTLPQEHGFPVRMLVPGIYGMKHCKWLTHIQVSAQDYQGYWEQRGWSDLAGVRLTSRIDTPLDGSNVRHNEVTYIAGVAFSGNKGISEVDVSLDGGNTWQRATLKRPLSPLTWVLWEYNWRPTSRGSYTIVVRAIDLEGNVQNPAIAAPLPNGASGYDSIDISVV